MRSGNVSKPLGCKVRFESQSQYLSFSAESEKATIRTFKTPDSELEVILKGSPIGGLGEKALASEFQFLGFVRSRLSEHEVARFSVPIPITSFEREGWHFAAQSVVAGQPLSELIFLRSRRRRLHFLRHEFSRCLEIAASIPVLLKQNTAARKLSPDWYQLPTLMQAGIQIKETLAAEAEKWTEQELCAHGDFTIENVFWDARSQKVSVIDWEMPMLGAPLLYDAFTLLFSSLPALALEAGEAASSGDRLEAQFQAAFFGSGEWANATSGILRLLSESLSEPVSGIWDQMLSCLVIRTNYFLWRQPSLGREYSRLLRCALLSRPPLAR